MTIDQLLKKSIETIGEQKAADLIQKPIETIQKYLSRSRNPSFADAAMIIDAASDSVEPIPEHVEDQTAKALWLRSHTSALSEETVNILLDTVLGQGERDIMVLFPCYRETNPATTWALVAAAADLGRGKMRMDIRWGDAVIRNSRNKLADLFMATNAKWSVWLDDDVVPPIGRAAFTRDICHLTPQKYPDAVGNRNFIQRLISHGKTMVGGVYYGRDGTGVPVFSQGRVDRLARDQAKAMTGNLIATQWIGTGCLAVHRSVYLDIQKKFPELAPTATRPYWDYFKMDDDTGEDVAFCIRAKESGHQPYADTGCVCGHVGKKVYGAWDL